MSRTARLSGLISTVFVLIALPAQAAMAHILPQPRPRFAPNETHAPVLAPHVVHITTSTGVATWMVIVIALCALAIGAGAGQLVRAVRRHQSPSLVTA